MTLSDLPAPWMHRWWTAKTGAVHIQCTSEPHGCRSGLSHTSGHGHLAPAPSRSNGDNDEKAPPESQPAIIQIVPIPSKQQALHRSMTIKVNYSQATSQQVSESRWDINDIKLGKDLSSEALKLWHQLGAVEDTPNSRSWELRQDWSCYTASSRPAYTIPIKIYFKKHARVWWYNLYFKCRWDGNRIKFKGSFIYRISARVTWAKWDS